MKTLFISICFFSSLFTNAQLCPGGGTNFSNSVFFDPSWISACSSGTSCTGGTVFDNRTACEPTAAMDGCAPSPTCGITANMGSDLWYKFYATGTTASINVVPSVSFFATLQAFSGGPLCGSLTEMGCSIATGPSTGATLNLTGLTAGNLYYFRVFGTAGSPSQRTGTFCFCGSAGMSNVSLPVKLLSFNGVVSSTSIILKWSTANQINFSHFNIEKSINGINFISIGNLPANSFQNNYSFEDKNIQVRSNLYRLKMIDADGKFEYSPVIKVNSENLKAFLIITDNKSQRLIINIDKDCEIDFYSASGAKFSTIKIKAGINNIYSYLPKGIYWVKRRDNGDIRKIVITK